jgi:hypothetical protein
MTSLLVMTLGRTDVQLAVGNERHKLNPDTCGTLHDAIKERSWSVVDAPSTTNKRFIKELPEGALQLCTPKLDAVLAHIAPSLPASVLIFETNRQVDDDPRFAGEVIERRLRDRGVENVTRVAFLTRDEKLEDPTNVVDAVIRRSVVSTLSNAIVRAVSNLKPDDSVIVATPGGLNEANELVNELVRLHSVGGPQVTALKVPDGNRANGHDRAVEEKFHPAAGYRARRHALSLVEKGNLLAAWGAVSHLEGVPGQDWIQVISWLAAFASSLPLSEDCDFAVLRHQRMAVRAALRVELSLRAGDIPRAVLGTVAFSEAALWDKLLEHFERTGARKGVGEVVRLKDAAPVPTGKLLRNDEPDESQKRYCPFERLDDGTYLFFEDGAGRFARDYVKSDPLKDLHDVIGRVKALRNDVAHNEPTPDLMKDARSRMQDAALWSTTDTFLSQALVQEVLTELGEGNPKHLLPNLLEKVRYRLVASSSPNISDAGSPRGD